MNLHKITRFLFYLLIHSFGFYLIYYVVSNHFLMPVIHKELSLIFPFCIHLVSCGLYFLLTWKDLYSYDYHYFLLSNKIIILKNIMYTTLFIPLCVVLFLIFNPLLLKDPLLERYIFISLILLICNIISFIVINLMSSSWISHLVKAGYLKKNIMIIGNKENYPELDTLFPYNQISKKYTGTLTLKNRQWYFHDSQRNTKKISYKQIKNLLCRLNVGEVIITNSPELPRNAVSGLVDYCKNNSIDYSLIDSIQKIPKKSFWLGITTYVTVFNNIATHRDSLMQITFKRILDLVLVAFSLFLFLPLSLFIALAIKLEDGGPILYVSKRVGINGKIIKFYKFRSMILNAEVLKQKLLKYNERGDGPLFKIKNDPRVTRVGRIIRKYSMDELPQLISVLKGDLSLVGPRPHLINEVEAYSDHDMLRLECVPGVTGLPQIYGRNTLSFEKWVSLDLSYRKNWSFYFDLKILVKSLRIVIAPFFTKSYQ
ncbi:MAG: exopolysaccharide biosynthesis polyprenyl glycosylphosphotransferase [Spirochaetales bacterium]|nr:exopolysaccharide biosynthesis polyprenyl glycosylphosphotransferase [Spirochaetales bacterium]